MLNFSDQRLVSLLMAGGLVPFLLGLTALWVGHMHWLFPIVLGYAAIILSFMAGIHWALAITQSALVARKSLLIQSNVLAVLAWWLIWWAHPILAPLMLMPLFGFQLYLDCNPLKEFYPRWYRQQRCVVTAFVMISLAGCSGYFAFSSGPADAFA